LFLAFASHCLVSCHGPVFVAVFGPSGSLGPDRFNSSGFPLSDNSRIPTMN
jgi:hypothetical protein